MSNSNLVENYPDFFVSEDYGDILWIKFSGNFFENIIDFDKRDFLSDFFKSLSENQQVKTVIIQAAYSESGVDEYLHFFQRNCPKPALFHMGVGVSRYEPQRFCNIIDQAILDIAKLNKFTIFTCQSSTISLFMNMGLACDYRIVSRDMSFYNTYKQIGMVPKGGGPFFLSRMLGRGKANQLLLLNDQISADEALELGIVDRVTARDQLEEETMAMANSFNTNSYSTLRGVKKLTHFPIDDLEQYLYYETNELLRIWTGMQSEE